MRILTATFALTLLYAHSGSGVLDQPLSMFRDGSQRYLGETLFLLLGMIGVIAIRQLLSAQNIASAGVLSLSFLLLLVVAMTPSFDQLHKLCALGLLSLISAYYTVWLFFEKPSWRWPHFALMSLMVLGAAFGSYGFWQKALILYVVWLINLQYSCLTMTTWRTCVDLTVIERWGGVRTGSILFVVALCFAHRHVGTLDLPLSAFREGNQWYVGAILFLLLGVIGAILIHKLLSLRGYVGVFTLSLGFVLLLIVALTQSSDEFHNLCAFGLLSLIGIYYTMWLNLEKPNWLWPHIVLLAVIFMGAAFGSYGFWQKTFVLYVVALINVQYSWLSRISPHIGVQYTLYPSQRLPPRRMVYRLDREFYGSGCDES